jgi:hypothetical protein
MNSLATFLQTRTLTPEMKKQQIASTNTCMKGGNYNITEKDYNKFNELYYDSVFNKKHVMHITEKQAGQCIAIDLDFHYPPEIVDRQYTNSTIADIIDVYLKSIPEFFKITEDNEFNVYVMERSHVNIVHHKDKGKYNKDGLHIIIGIKMEHSLQLKMREMVKSNIADAIKDVQNVNSIDDIVDKTVCSGSSNWTKLGSCKPDNEAYKLTQIINCKYDLTDMEVSQTHVEFDSVSYKYVEMCSVQYPNNPEFELKSKWNIETASTASIGSVFSATSSLCSVDNKRDYLYFKYGMQMGLFDKILKPDNTANLRTDWLRLCCAIKHTFGLCDISRELWRDACSVNESFKEHIERDCSVIETMEPTSSPITIATAIKWMKDCDIVRFKEMQKRINAETTVAIIPVDSDKVICDNDNEAGDEILKRVKDMLIYCNGQYFLKLEHIWIVDDLVKIDSFLLNYIMNSKIYKFVNGKHHDYVQNVSCAKRVMEALKAKLINIPSIDIYSKFHSTTKNRVCFRDGVLDFKLKRFFTWEQIDFEFYTIIMIPRDFKEYFNNPDKQVIAEIKSKIFKNLFDNDTEKALQFLSRGITGNVQDKDWATYLGRRDCGKGVLFEILQSGFGKEYVQGFELENICFVRETQKSGDASKELYWLLALQFVRLAISQEVPKPESGKKASGKLIKKLASGGDELIARRNYDKVDKHFTIDSTFWIMGNDYLNVDIEDTNEHRHEFKSVNSFKTQDELDIMRENGEPELVIQSYKLKDPLIKDNCMTEAWGNALVYLLFESYITHSIPIVREIDGDVESVRSKILKKYIITKNIDDIILASDIKQNIDEHAKKIQPELLSMGCLYKKHQHNSNYKNKWCYYGIQLIPTETVFIDDA